MNFVPLTPDRLAEAQTVAAELFPWETEHQAALPAALDVAGADRFLAERGLASVRCWVAEEAGAVAGLACLYTYRAEPEEVWLAWFGLRPAARGRGHGAAMLDWIMAAARAEGRQVMRLWTTDEAEYVEALQLYARRGFQREDCPPLPGEDWRTFVLSRTLDGTRVEAWFARPNRRELCGREIPVPAAAAA